MAQAYPLSSQVTQSSYRPQPSQPNHLTIPHSPLHELFNYFLRLSVVGRSLYLPCVAMTVEVLGAVPGLLLAGTLFFGSLPNDVTFRTMASIPLGIWSALTILMIYFSSSRHIRLFLDTLVKGGRPTPTRAEAAWVEALALPSRIVRQLFFIGLVDFGLGAWFLIRDWGTTVVLLYLLATFVGGATILTIAFFVLEWAMLPVIERCYYYGARGNLMTADIARSSQQQKLMGLIAVTLSVTLALLVTLIYTHASQIPGLAAGPLLRSILSIGVLSLPLGLLLSWLLVSTVSGTVNSLTTAMEQVAAGNLEAHAPVVTTDELGTLASRFNEMVTGLREREALRDAFGRYVSPEIAQAVLSGGTHLGGTTLEATIIFVDIRNFTGLSETLLPEQVITLLNSYYSTMVDVVHTRGGLVNKFVGDGMLIVFGAPVPRQDHPIAAVETALAMREALYAFNEHQGRLGHPQLQIGIGIASGEVVAGNVGSAARLEYTVLGDTVNLASRIQDLCKQLKHDILISHTTHAALPTSIQANPCPNTVIRGKQQSVTIYRIERLA